METELTKRIKTLTHHFRPKIKSEMRTIRWADEVWTPTGIVDSIRFEDYYDREEHVCPYIEPERFHEKEVKETCAGMHPLGVCFRDGTTSMGVGKCHGCVFHHRRYHVGMMCSCYEVKITLADFKSKNGHNFHGNENYYCVPKALAPKIEGLVSDDIGILAYYEGEKQYGLRLYKEARWRDVSSETMARLLYDAMKKWCDGAIYPHEPISAKEEVILF